MADTLSRAPLLADTDNTSDELMEGTNLYVDRIIEHLTVRTSYLDSLKYCLNTDNLCSSIMKMCQESNRCTNPERLLLGRASFSFNP